MSDVLSAARRSWGGLEGLLAAVPEGKRAEIVLRLAQCERELLAKAREVERAERSAVVQVEKAARDPATVAAAVELLAGMRPRDFRPVFERLIVRARGNRQPMFDGDGAGV